MTCFMDVFAGSVLFLVAASICYGLGGYMMAFLAPFPVLFQMLGFIAGIFLLFGSLFLAPLICLITTELGDAA